MSAIYSVLNLNDDVEIFDYQYNLKSCFVQIKNQAGYIQWKQNIEYFSNSLTKEKIEFGNKPNQINILSKGKPIQAELIIYDNKIFLKNKDQDQILYQLQNRQQVRMENVLKINQYSVNYDKKNKIIKFSDGLNITHSLQLTQSRQLLIINEMNFGVAFQESDGSIQYIGNNLCIFCGIKQNEEIELRNYQNFQHGINQLYIEYQFY